MQAYLGDIEGFVLGQSNKINILIESHKHFNFSEHIKLRLYYILGY